MGGWSSAGRLCSRTLSGCWAPGGLRLTGPEGPPHSDPTKVERGISLNG